MNLSCSKEKIVFSFLLAGLLVSIGCIVAATFQLTGDGQSPDRAWQLAKATTDSRVSKQKYVEALAIAAKVNDPFKSAQIRMDYANWLDAAGRTGDATEALRAAIGDLNSTPMRLSTSTNRQVWSSQAARAHLLFANCLAKQRQFANAEENYKRALSFEEASFGPVSTKLSILQNYANCLRAAGRESDAEELSATVYGSTLSKAECQRNLRDAEQFLSSGKLQECESILARVANTCKNLGPRSSTFHRWLLLSCQHEFVTGGFKKAADDLSQAMLKNEANLHDRSLGPKIASQAVLLSLCRFESASTIERGRITNWALSNYRPTVIKSLVFLADCLANNGKHADSSRVRNTLLALCNNKSTIHERGKALTALAQSLEFEGKTVESIRYLKEAVSYADNNLSCDETILALDHLAGAYVRAKKPTELLGAVKLLHVPKRFSNRERACIKANALIDESVAYAMLRLPDQAERSARMALDTANQSSDPIITYKARYHLGDCLLAAGSYNQAREVYLLNLEFSRKSQDKNMLLDDLGRLASTEDLQGNCATAIKLNLESWNILKSFQPENKTRRLYVLSCLANLLSRQKKFSEAIDWANQWFADYEKNKTFWKSTENTLFRELAIQIFMDIGARLHDAGLDKEAMLVCSSNWQVIDGAPIRDLTLRYRACLQLNSLCMFLKEYPQARQWLSRAMSEFDVAKVRDKSVRYTYLMRMGDIARAQSQFDEATKFQLQELNYAETTYPGVGNKNLADSIERTTSHVQVLLGNNLPQEAAKTCRLAVNAYLKCGKSSGRDRLKSTLVKTVEQLEKFGSKQDALDLRKRLSY